MIMTRTKRQNFMLLISDMLFIISTIEKSIPVLQSRF